MEHLETVPWNVTLTTGTPTRIQVPQPLQAAYEVWVHRYYLDACKASDSSVCKGASYAVEVGRSGDGDVMTPITSSAGVGTSSSDVYGVWVVDEKGGPQMSDLNKPVKFLSRANPKLWQWLTLSLIDELGFLESAGTAITKASQGASKPVLTLCLSVVVRSDRPSALPALPFQRESLPGIKVVSQL